MKKNQISLLESPLVVFLLGVLTGAIIVGAVALSNSFGDNGQAFLFNYSGNFGMEDPDVLMQKGTLGIKSLNGLKGMEDPDVVMYK